MTENLFKWELINAMQLCAYKAWQLRPENNAEIDYSIDENIIHVYLSADDISISNKICTIAWYQLCEGFAKDGIDRIKIYAGGHAEIIRLTKQNAKALKLAMDAKVILNNNEAPAFYKIPHCNECRFKDPCMRKFKERDCISLLGGMSPATISKYHKKGIFTILQLSHLFRPRRRNRMLHKSGLYHFELKALAIREQKTYVLHKPEIKETEVAVYIDMEGLPDKNFIYLIGGLIKTENKEDEPFSFWADNTDEQEIIFEKLFDLLEKYPDADIYHYGSYEAKAIRLADKNRFIEIEKRMINILSFLRTHVYPPTYRNGLKEVANYIGFNWSDPDANGLLSIKWRKDWELTGMDTCKEKLIRYNLDDCKALIFVRQWLNKLSAGNTENVQQVAAMKRHSPYKFDSNLEFGEEYKTISKAAYFDYQRSKIYWRKGKAAPKNKKQPTHLGRGHVIWQPKKVNEIIQMPVLKKCPNCGHGKLYRSVEQRKYKVTDLKFTPSGIKQWVIEYHSGKGKCARCAMKYNDSALRQPRFGDNLFAWATNLYVNYHLSFAMISRLLHEQFGIWAGFTYFNDRNYSWWQRFKPEVSYCLEIIRNSPVIHIDETTVRLTKGKGNGYIWAFATSHTVFYHLTLNREAEFLKEMLKDYQGIIITDFFAGYDQLPFKRQKCLIHLIRDLNDDLFKTPFDEAFRSLVDAFGKLLKKIILTIDRYGLKTRNLKKHVRETIEFQKEFLGKKDGSEMYAKYAKRFRRHWDELWVFLHHDDVPWNNNNAEAAIKGFALHRRSVNGIVSEAGLKEYLSMLTIAQTCRYRNISFLDYLRRKAGIWQNVPPEILPGYVPMEQQKVYAQKMNFKTAREWQEWKNSGKLPAFISPEYFFIKQPAAAKTKIPSRKKFRMPMTVKKNNPPGDE